MEILHRCEQPIWLFFVCIMSSSGGNFVSAYPHLRPADDPVSAEYLGDQGRIRALCNATNSDLPPMVHCA